MNIEICQARATAMAAHAVEASMAATEQARATAMAAHAAEASMAAAEQARATAMMAHVAAKRWRLPLAIRRWR